MKDDDDTAPAQTGRRHQLAEERSRLRGELAALRAASAEAGQGSEGQPEQAALEQRIGAIDEELERIDLAAEIERQKDA
ncbi:hypothetical protein [Lentisalinibacter sediminis]|uniref:hypothetical protein n=1 Tax=Lentisalinibacter sediminis TaxID=2992237 RepID=UPI00386D73A0